MSKKIFRILLTTLLFSTATTVSAHEMFLKARQSIIEPDTKQVVQLVNGTFDKSENAITRDRMADVSILANGEITKPVPSAWHDDENSSYLTFAARSSGTYVVGVSTRPRILTMSPEEFIAYLKHDGVLDTLAEFESRNTLTPVREKYSKHVRTFLQVGEQRSADFEKPLGYPVEIIPEHNPYELRFGDRLSFRVLRDGKPVRGQLVRAGYDGFHGHDASGGHINSYELRTDENGRASVLLSNKALWYISLIHMEKVGRPDYDYESNWATATFLVR